MVDNLKQLFKVRTIKGYYCHLKHIDIKDAYLIHDLRLKRPDFIEKTSPNLEVQKLYLEQYFKSFQKNMQIYYKVYDLKENTFIGVFRLTELNNDLIFNWESSVFKKKCTNLSNCKVMQSQSDINQELRVAILKKAAQYKLEDTEKNKKN